MEKTLTDDLFPLSHAGFNCFLVLFYVVYCIYYYLRVKNLPTRKYAQSKTSVNIQPSLFNFKSSKVLASTKLSQRSNGSTIPIDNTSLFPPPKIYIHLAAHNAPLCNLPANLYYTEIFPKILNFNLMGGNFSMCTASFVGVYLLKSIAFLILSFQLLSFRVFDNFQKRWILR